jgi:hypothetical protein
MDIRFYRVVMCLYLLAWMYHGKPLVIIDSFWGRGQYG